MFDKEITPAPSRLNLCVCDQRLMAGKETCGSESCELELQMHKDADEDAQRTGIYLK